MPKKDLRLVDTVMDSFKRDLRTALDCPPELLRQLASELDTDRGFRLLEESRVMRAWSEAGLAADTLSDTFRILKHIFQFGCKHERSPDDLLAEVREVCSRHDIPGFEERQGELKLLLTPSARYLERRRALPWSRSVFPILVGIDASAELRGVFESATSEEVVGLVPLAVLRLAVRYDDDDKTQTSRIAMQLTEEDVDKIIARLEQSKARMKRLKALAKKGGAEVFDEAIAGQWSTAHEE